MNNKDFQNGFALGLASGGVVEVEDTTEIDNLETLIDESGVLDSAEGSVSEKVEELIDKVEYELNVFRNIVIATSLFNGAKSFPNKAIINLPNATNVHQLCANWNINDIPYVEEITINAPKATTSNLMFRYVGSVIKKVILKLPDEGGAMNSTFYDVKNLEEVVLNFSTKNVANYESTFYQCQKLKRIIGNLDFSSAQSNGMMFLNCYNLEEVTFEPNTLSISINLSWCDKLTGESKQSIIDGLATVETAQTLTLNSTITLTDEQKATINEKGWTLAQ